MIDFLAAGAPARRQGPLHQADPVPPYKAAPEEEARRRSELEEAERQQRASGEGNKRRCKKEGNPPEPPDKAQRNFTDAESRIMQSSEGSFVQAYNAQAALDDDSSTRSGAGYRPT